MRHLRTGLTWGPVQKGATPWQDLPEYVQERVKNRPWDDTPEDKFIQRLDAGLFVVRTPENHQREIWISAPVAQLANGISMIGVLEYGPNPESGYPGEMFPDVDERVMIWLGRLRPDMQFNVREYLKMKDKVVARLEANKNRLIHDQAGEMVDKAFSAATDAAKDGQLLRPVAPVLVDGLRA